MGGAKGRPLGVTPEDVRTYLWGRALEIAPRDLLRVASRRGELERLARTEASKHPLFARQLRLAGRILDDHVRGRCPQIPYGAVILLAAACLYALQAVDVVPDFLPEGRADDALVMALAFEMARPGVVRYCEAFSVPADVFAPGDRRARRQGRRPLRFRSSSRSPVSMSSGAWNRPARGARRTR
ncbi:MAG: hypothetical protein KatS3mg076_1212 [Candidatus Binatia bacterium]|nr:MAG: hypothetical protein KatS3mg076_1212 [Candidatus Binatia bacterium]